MCQSNLENPLDFFHGARYDNYIACPDKKGGERQCCFPLFLKVRAGI